MDISNELVVSKFGDGIKLFRPRKDHKLQTIENLLQLPFSVYLETAEQVVMKSNEITAQACGFDSINAFIGKPWFNYFKKHTIVTKLANHKRAIVERSTILAEESALLQSGERIDTLSVRMPWYNDKNKVIGLFGCSIVLGKNPLAETLLQFAKLGLLNHERFKQKTFEASSMLNNGFSNRETECLRLTIRGKSAKQVAFEMGLSQRTVEQYLENIKKKMNVVSKAALIEKAMEYFYGKDFY